MSTIEMSEREREYVKDQIERVILAHVVPDGDDLSIMLGEIMDLIEDVRGEAYNDGFNEAEASVKDSVLKFFKSNQFTDMIYDIEA